MKILAAIFKGKFTYVQEWAYRLSNGDVIQHNIYINTAIHFILSYVSKHNNKFHVNQFKTITNIVSLYKKIKFTSVLLS